MTSYQQPPPGGGYQQQPYQQPYQGYPQPTYPQGYPGAAPSGQSGQGWAGPPQGIPVAQAPAPQQVPQGLPQLYTADPALIAAAHQKAMEEADRIARARAGGATKGRWWNPPGPTGQDKWDASVPVGYAAKTLVWVCPPWNATRQLFQDEVTHFWKSARAPQGTSVTCPGEAVCPVCFANKLLYRPGTAGGADRARYGKARRQALFQILLLEFPQSHWDQATGRMVPWLFRASSQVKKGILDVYDSRAREGLGDLTDPNAGSPIWVVKTKTGLEKMDVEWGVQRSESRPLHQSFWPALHNLWQLDQFVRTPTQQDLAQAVIEMGLPMTAEVQQLLAAIPAAAPQGAPPGQPAQPQVPSMVPPGSPWGQPQGPVSAALQAAQYPQPQAQPQNPGSPPLQQLQTQLQGGR